MILNVEKVEKSFGARVLFSGASFQVNAGDRFALVGPNGAGKTTLLKIIMVSIRPMREPSPLPRALTWVTSSRRPSSPLTCR